MLKGLETIEGLTPEQAAAVNELAGGLASKNQELLDKLNGTKTEVNTAASELEKLRQFKTLAEQQEAESKANYDEALRIERERGANELQRLQESNNTYKTQLESTLIDGGLSKALDGAKINPALKDGALNLLKGQIKVEDGKAVTLEGKSLSEFVSEWSESEAGKSYVLAPDNRGAGATGGGGAGHTIPTIGKASTQAEKADIRAKRWGLK